MRVTYPENPADHVRERFRRAAERPEAWIDLRPEEQVATELTDVLRQAQAGRELPLAGRLFAVKGNIDVAGLPTTAACSSYAYEPAEDATTVGRLRAAGAVVIGTTNLDQFATGLVGTRSPYGAVRHATHPERISGGSSSGSAVATTLGAVDFALGTDTAGSGRIPAAFHGLFGLKPTKGWVSAAGAVPACRSQDVITVMSEDLRLARHAVTIMSGPDPRDSLSRPKPAAAPTEAPASPLIGIPRTGQLGELAPGWTEAYTSECAAWQAEGKTVEIDIEPFLAAARLLYEGGFVAERYTAVGAFIDSVLSGEDAASVDPTVAAIITKAKEIPAWQVFADTEKLAETSVYAREVFSSVDALLLPTTVRHPTLDEVAADPVGVNSELGRFTNFANLLDLSALAYPAGTAEGLPFGVQLVAPAFHDDLLSALVGRRLTDGGLPE